MMYHHPHRHHPFAYHTNCEQVGDDDDDDG